MPAKVHSDYVVSRWIVKRLLQRNGYKVSHFTSKEITAYAKEVAGDQKLMQRARRTIAREGNNAKA